MDVIVEVLVEKCYTDGGNQAVLCFMRSLIVALMTANCRS